MSWYSDREGNKGRMLPTDVEFYRYFKKVPNRMLNTGSLAGGIATIDPKRIWCCDIDKEVIKNAKKSGMHADYVDLNTRTPYNDNFFDAVYSYGVLEHLKNTENALKEFYRILKPNGRLVLCVPDIQKIKWRFWEGYDHFSPITKYSLNQLAYIAGFRKYTIKDQVRRFKGMNRLIRKGIMSPDRVLFIQNVLYLLRIRDPEMIVLEAVKPMDKSIVFTVPPCQLPV